MVKQKVKKIQQNEYICHAILTLVLLSKDPNFDKLHAIRHALQRAFVRGPVDSEVRVYSPLALSGPRNLVY